MPHRQHVQGNATPHPGTVLSSFLQHLAQPIKAATGLKGLLKRVWRLSTSWFFCRRPLAPTFFLNTVPRCLPLSALLTRRSRSGGTLPMWQMPCRWAQRVWRVCRKENRNSCVLGSRNMQSPLLVRATMLRAIASRDWVRKGVTFAERCRWLSQCWKWCNMQRIPGGRNEG